MVTNGVRPLTEAELTDRGPNPLLATAYHGAEVLRWSARVYPGTSFLLPVSLRRALLRLAGLKIGAQVTGLRHCGFQTRNVTIGDGAFVNVGCWFEGAGEVEIGRNAFIGPQVMFLTSHHPIDENGEVERMPQPSKVRIGDRCWIGARSMVMPGVSIGDGTVIGAGSVVTKDCDPGALYVGMPARRVRLA